MGSFSPDLAITGATQTGFTSPTYTMVADLAPDVASRQWIVSALGGTQTDVRPHVAGDPFTITARRSAYRALPSQNPVNGSYGNVPMNKIEILVRKGLKIDTSGTIRIGNLRVIAELPAGSNVSDAPNIRALASAALGLMAEESADYGDTLVSGVI